MTKRRLLVSALAGVAALVVAAPATAAKKSLNIQAYGVSGNLLGAPVGPIALANLGTPNASVLNFSVPPLLSTGAITASVTQDTSLGTESSTATTANLSATLVPGITISAGALTATCSATDGSSPVGTSNFTNLVIPGVTVPVNPAPNTVINVPPGPIPPTLITVTLNEQNTVAGSLTVNAVHIRVLGSAANAIISSATCGPAPVVPPIPIASGAGLYLGLALLAGSGAAATVVMRRRRHVPTLV
ncbi:choice-of-anchor P family protein [Rhizohabitans arisaemae]|uniref:choice-of-anchor P family protein n=1 Tax=Rhizohabitans arisaemae TaxID=2720610 RepID=UPI0024B18C62|nr:choice-of-anchor P family protein [Rhizohabitans arisaemae]